MSFFFPAFLRFLLLFIVVGVIRAPQPIWDLGILALLFLAACIWQFVTAVQGLIDR